jgi:hypothetical protein
MQEQEISAPDYIKQVPGPEEGKIYLDVDFARLGLALVERDNMMRGLVQRIKELEKEVETEEE